MARLFLTLLLTTGLLGCQSAYYATMEKVGVHKRDILVDRVEETQEAQTEAQEQFQDALEQFKSVVQFDGGELESIYEALNDEYEDSASAAETVSDRIDAVEDVAEDLFSEWQDELEEYQSAKLKRSSDKKLKATQRQYKKLISAMHRAERKMEPVLATLKDNVLYLKHNLNASAIGALKGELSGIQKEVAVIISEMNKSIAESNRFIQALSGKD